MKFLIDAQLPKKLSALMNDLGFDSIHTLDLPNGNRTKDGEVVDISMKELRVVISKDADFYDTFLQKSAPYKLIYLTTGNISNQELCDLFTKNIEIIKIELIDHQVIEINPTSVITLI